ncbi:beta-catenin-like protein 1 [Neodiprion pinetum]|uniref:Beta-catenin-like protein 1 n=1 Tax=Neodiprion lecontei TaxID=441921 RepID=A0A6J0BQI7_NEOLC|nr:beta-catenin-like protein 1 [Neodiprion lecontei]XP_046412812.1 beta-catenin-like protein 1 [Neodiprion fabricii]XP_046468240.1 beta-catenin-like protein 1 [Neodiprion pinetum]XP_046607554.1 beta-catenin-like protein 1 [Neodiprion virginianus]
MDIGELLSYKPPNTPKRPVHGDEEDEDNWENAKRSKRVIKTPYHPRQRQINEGDLTPAVSKEPPTPIRAALPAPANDVVEPQLTEKEKQEIIKYVETEAAEVEALDEATLKRMILLFEKRALRNQEMRVKFPDQPEKFMESELELHETLQELNVVATAPDLYPIMVELGAVASMLELLSHENTDIAVGVADLLQELTDVDILHESQEGADILIDSLLEQQVCALLVQNLERLDESVKEESDGVHNTLAIFENLLEFRPDLCVDAGKQGLLQWLLRRIKVKAPFDGNKLYASELLSILVQQTPENRLLLGDLDGIDALLQQLAFYKRHDPRTAEEQEMMENLFNVLCSSLMATINRERFLRGEGLQLMNLMLREKKMSRNGSLKVLDHAMNGPDGKDNCMKFVDILGLRTIFPLFMKTPTKNRKKILTTEEHEEHVVSIIASMLRNCKGAQRQRLISKFTENDFEKVDRLMELHFKYLEKVEEVERDTKDDEEEEESYMRRLDGGLFILQLVDYVLLEACTGCPPTVKQRVTRILAQRRASLKTIRHIMREYAGNLGDAGDNEWREAEQQHILQLIDKF